MNVQLDDSKKEKLILLLTQYHAVWFNKALTENQDDAELRAIMAYAEDSLESILALPTPEWSEVIALFRELAETIANDNPVVALKLHNDMLRRIKEIING